MDKVEVKLDNIDKALLNILQTEFPLEPQPFKAIARRLKLEPAQVISRVSKLKENHILRQISAIFDSRALGYSSALVAMKVEPERRDEAANIINLHPGVSHNYARNHTYNLWFTLTVPPGQSLKAEADNLQAQTQAESVMILPTIRLFKIGVAFDMMDSDSAPSASINAATMTSQESQPLSEEDISAIQALQEDTPLEDRPFKRLAAKAGMTESQLLEKARFFLASGVMRRFAATLRHRNAGFVANAMGVWVVPENRIEEAGRIMAGFSAVSHCYQRPTYPDWPYSLFTMIHGRSIEECEQIAKSISQAAVSPDYRLLYSTKEYKKIRVKYFDAADTE
ncbi:MAG: AsnC family transcriptional regulator [Armatimonadota bacterium]|nr:AsnC family transcriptional regulator [Armatimonadota bacterium]